jgi:ubiquinone/menaquinone biosynthesis C-methylase UbiE
VQEIFGEKWRPNERMGIDDSSPYRSFMREWMFRKYGWNDEQGFASDLKNRKTLLDAGTGLGREVVNMAKVAEAGSFIVGLELSDYAKNALRNVAAYPNAYIVQGDILRMPFAESTFDFILSEGVLHHTPDTKGAFSKCCRVLKKGGEIAFYVYKKKGPLREFADDYVRKIMIKASSDEKWQIARRITSLGKALSDTKAVVKIADGIPELGIVKGEIQIQRFVYWNLLKCFWNDELPFEENLIVNFDWYAPEHAHRHTADEVKRWCAENGMEIDWFHEEESGFSVRACRT